MTVDYYKDPKTVRLSKCDKFVCDLCCHYSPGEQSKLILTREFTVYKGIRVLYATACVKCHGLSPWSHCRGYIEELE